MDDRLERVAIALFVSQTPQAQAQGIDPRLLWHDSPTAQKLFRELARIALIEADR